MPDPTLDATIRFAHNQHYGQVDKAGQPYILHVFRVMLSFTAEAERTVALLHNVVKDCGVTLDYLQKMRYPAEVIEAVDCVTKRPKEADDYDAFIRRVAAGPILARRVKIADLKDNADLSRFSSPSDDDRTRSAKYTAAIQLLETTLED